MASPAVPEESEHQMPDAPRRPDQGQEPLRQLGHYLLQRPIGRGGMATVYQARDTQIERSVAIKLVDVPAHLPPAELEAFVARMRREARAIGSLSHPNVVTILDVGEDNGLPFLVMEYLEGVTLRQRLDSDGALAPAQADAILTEVAAALEAAHRHGMLHRDIKPSNIMLVAPDGPNGSDSCGAPRVKLLDFGVARQVGDTVMTRTGLMVGSPAYMAPEIIRGESATVAADIWALGVLLYEMLAGRPAFDGQTIPAVFYQILEQTPVPPASASPALGRILMRALEKNPEKRFGSATELASAFHVAATAPSSDTVSTGNASREQRSGRTAVFATAFLFVTAVVIALLTLLPRQKDRSGRKGPVALSGPPRLSSPALLSPDRRAPVISEASEGYKPDVKAEAAATIVVAPVRANAAAHEQKPLPKPHRRRKISAARLSGTAVRRAASRPAATAAASTVHRPRPASPRQRPAQTRRLPRAAESPHRQRQARQTARPMVAAKRGKAPAAKTSLLARKIQLARNYIRLRKEARRVDQSNSAAVAAYNRKVYAFRRSRQQFNAAVKKTRRDQGK